jgi:hypothetical protein
MLEIFRDVMYDTVDVCSVSDSGAGNLQEFNLFRTVLSEDGKTYVQTNNYVQNRLPNPQEFVVEKLYCAFFTNEGVLPVTHPAYWKSSIGFFVGDLMKPYWISPCWAIAHPAAVLGHVENLTTEEQKVIKEYLTTGKLNSPTHGIHGIQELIIKGDRFFKVLLTCQYPKKPCDLKFIFLMEGTRKRIIY